MRWIAALSVLASTGLAGAQVQNPANGNWYFGGTPELTFFQARALAEATGGTLVAISDAAEQQWIVDEFTSSFTVLWIGLSDEITEGVFLWDSGDPLTYTNWAPGEPDDDPIGSPTHVQDYVQLSMLEGGQWQDAAAGLTDPSVIEYLAEPTAAVTNVDAVPGVGTVALTWQNPIAYDSIAIHRDGVLIATLPGTATMYFDADPIAVSRRYWIVGTVTGSPATPAFHTGLAIDPDYEISITSAPSVDAAPTIARVLLDNAANLQGWGYGVCHDDPLADVLAVEMGDATSTASGGLPPVFYSVGIYSGGFTVGVVVDFGINTLPAGEDHELELITYEPLVAPPALIPLEFCDTLGPVPVAVVVVHQGQTHIPVMVDGDIDVVTRTFIRSDCNGDVAPDIADVVFLGSYLFADGAIPPCLAACDANSDAILDVADMVYTALALFSGGPPPAAPYPDCGTEPAPSLECAIPSTCP